MICDDLIGRVDRDVIDEEYRRQTAMIRMQRAEEQIAELEEALKALDGAKILVRHGYRAGIEYGSNDEGWQDEYASRLEEIERSIEALKEPLEWKLRECRETLEDPLHEKRVAE